jgi:pimeloyl-ACP methyl ester carboxylesterase
VFSMGDPAHPRVVLVPGVTGSKEDFHFVFLQLVQAGYFVESYDLAGQYESHAAGPEQLDPPAERYGYELFVEDLVAFIEAGDGRPVHLLGYSFAGLVAQLVLVRRPELIASLALLSSPPLSGQSFRGVKWVGWMSWFAGGKAAAGLMRWGVESNVLKVRPGRLDFVRARFVMTRPQSHADIMRLMMRAPNLRGQLADAEVPIAVAVGVHDLWPLRMHRRFASAIGASLSIYRTGHSPCEDAPIELSANLVELYEKASTLA